MTVPGALLAGRYRLVSRVAAGGMGSVWEAQDELLQRRVAIKELHAQPGLGPDDAATARHRVIREARITARLHHPHAVTLYDVVDHDGQPCLILQYVPSRTLNSLLAEHGLLQIPFVTRIGAELASALAAAHHVGIVHRDVKPSNVLITPAGSAMITDFGISHAAGDVSLTSTGMVTGTPSFLAPEVARGLTSGFSADVFSLGATLYAALEGTPPFGSDQNAIAMLHTVASGQIIPPRRSGELTSVLLQMLAADPAARPTMSEVARLLGANPSAEPAPATVPRPRPQQPTIEATPAQVSAPAPVARHRRTVALITVAAFLMLAGLTFGALQWFSQRHGAPSAVATMSVTAPPSTAPNSARAHQTVRTSTPVPTTAASSPSVTPSSASHTTAATSAARSTAARSTAARSTAARAVPTPARLARAITGYYALLPGNTEQGWARLTSNFQTGTARDRQYYQSFWDGIQRVTAADAHGVGPDTAEATITYYFKDGRITVESTVYGLVQEKGVLKIDSSAVRSSNTG